MFYDVYTQLCNAKGVSRSRAAADMGLSNSTVTKWKKTGATPSGETMAKIAAYFGVSVDDLINPKSDLVPKTERTEFHMQNLINARKAMHKTQQEIADYLGISRQAYSNYEAGKREPDFETLLKLGEYFDCSVDYLLGTKNDPAQKGRVTDDDIKFALFDGAPVTDAQYEEVKRFAKYIAEHNIHPKDD